MDLPLRTSRGKSETEIFFRFVLRRTLEKDSPRQSPSPTLLRPSQSFGEGLRQSASRRQEPCEGRSAWLACSYGAKIFYLIKMRERERGNCSIKGNRNVLDEAGSIIFFCLRGDIFKNIIQIYIKKLLSRIYLKNLVKI